MTFRFVTKNGKIYHDDADLLVHSSLIDGSGVASIDDFKVEHVSGNQYRITPGLLWIKDNDATPGQLSHYIIRNDADVTITIPEVVDYLHAVVIYVDKGSNTNADGTDAVHWALVQGSVQHQVPTDADIVSAIGAGKPYHVLAYVNSDSYKLIDARDFIRRYIGDPNKNYMMNTTLEYLRFGYTMAFNSDTTNWGNAIIDAPKSRIGVTGTAGLGNYYAVAYNRLYLNDKDEPELYAKMQLNGGSLDMMFSALAYKTSGDMGCRIEIKGYDGSNWVDITQKRVFFYGENKPDVYRRVHVPFTIDTSYEQIAVVMKIYDGGYDTTVYFSDMKIEIGRTPTRYTLRPKKFQETPYNSIYSGHLNGTRYYRYDGTGSTLPFTTRRTTRIRLYVTHTSTSQSSSDPTYVRIYGRKFGTWYGGRVWADTPWHNEDTRNPYVFSENARIRVVGHRGAASDNYVNISLDKYETYI